MSAFPVRHAETDAEIENLYPVMRELRPHLKDVQDFLTRVRRQREQSGYRLIFATDAGVPVACAGYRMIEDLFAGQSLHVNDLICLEAFRGQGHAEALMRWMEGHAREQGCETIHLDSGTHRLRAHHFYFRLGLSITSFHFQKML